MVYFEGLRAIDNLANYGPPQKRYDDVTLSAFISEQVTDIQKRQYDRRYLDLEAKKHIPLSVSVAPGAQAWAYDVMDKRGRAAFLGANATDIPRVDISKQRITNPIRTSVLAYAFTIDEIELARWQGLPLQEYKAEACRRGQAEFEDELLLMGDAAHGIPGFLTNPATPRITVPNGNWLSGGTTSEHILEDLNAVQDQVWSLSSRVHRVTTILLPLAQYRKAVTTRISGIDSTALEFFSRTNGFATEILPLPHLANIGPTGGPAMLAYQKDPSVLSGIIPLAYQEMEPQPHGMEVVIPTRQKEGGTVWFYPMAGAFGDGI